MEANNLIDEVRQLFDRVFSTKTQIPIDIINKESLNANELSDGLHQMQPSTEPVAVSDDFVQALNGQSMDQPNSPILQQQARDGEHVEPQISIEWIEQFRLNGYISDDDQTQIVDAMNQLMGLTEMGKNVRILRDCAYESWICCQYRPRISIIVFYTPMKNFEWRIFHNGNPKFSEELRPWLPREDRLESIRYPVWQEMSDDHQTSFLMVLVFALVCFYEVLESDIRPFSEMNKENIRLIISKVFTEKRMPSIEEINTHITYWKPEKNII